MSDRDDTRDDKTTPAASSNGNAQSFNDDMPWLRLFATDGEPESEAEQTIRKRFEKLAADLLHERLGTPVNEDGSPDLSELTQDELDGDMPDLAVELLTTYLKAIRPALRDKRDGVGEADDGDDHFANVKLKPGEKEFLGRAAEDIKLVLGLMGKRVDESSEEGRKLAERIQRALGDRLNEFLEAIGSNAGALAKAQNVNLDTFRGIIGDRIVGLVRQLGTMIAESKTPIRRLEGFESGFAAGSTPAGPAVAPGGAATAEPATGGASAGSSAKKPDGEVIFLEEVRKKIEAKQEQLSGLPDVISKLLAEAGTTSASGTQGINLNLDQSFFKEHGPTLLKELFDGFSKTILPKKVEVTLPMTPQEEAAAKGTASQAPAEDAPAEDASAEDATAEDATAETSEGDQVKVSINLDLANLLGGLFRPKEPGSDTK